MKNYKERMRVFTDDYNYSCDVGSKNIYVMRGSSQICLEEIRTINTVNNFKELEVEVDKFELPDEVKEYFDIISKETALFLYKNNLEKVLFIDDNFQESYVSDKKQFNEYNIFAVEK